MKYLFLLLLLCGCTEGIKENSLTIYSIDRGNEEYKYQYTIKGEIDSTTGHFLRINSNQEFRVGDTVKLTLSKEN